MVSGKFRCGAFQVHGELRGYMWSLLLTGPTGRGSSAAFTLPYIFIQFAHAGAVVRLGDSLVA